MNKSQPKELSMEIQFLSKPSAYLTKNAGQPYKLYFSIRLRKDQTITFTGELIKNQKNQSLDILTYEITTTSGLMEESWVFENIHELNPLPNKEKVRIEVDDNSETAQGKKRKVIVHYADADLDAQYD